MKCLCGYEFIKFNGKDKPFIKFGYLSTNYSNISHVEDHSSFYVHTFYACPICGTLKIDLEV